MIFPAERQRQILERLDAGGSVRVVDLAQRFSVAEETIRRDLEKLDAEGKLVRTHGGAVAVDEPRRQMPFELRTTTHRRAKRAVAMVAASRIDEGDVIALDASSTCLELARLLPDLPLTVVTSSPVVPPMLVDRPSIVVVCTGGELDAGPMSYVGWLAEAALGRFNLHKAIISCRGVDAERGLSEATEPHARLKRRMIDLAQRTIVLADASKLGVRSSVFYAELADVDELITDPSAEPQRVDAFAAAGVRITVAPATTAN